MRTRSVFALLSGALALAACSDGSGDLPSAPARPKVAELTPALASVTPYVVEGAATCAGINASWTEFRIDAPAPGSHYSPDDLVQVTLSSSDGIRFDWLAYGPQGPYLAAVLVSGSSSANVYVYTPPVTSDVGLHSPVGANGQLVAPDLISFCYDRDIAILNGLSINPAAFGRVKRTWSWQIDKSADQSNLSLPIGEQVLVNYAVDMFASYVDSEHQVYGYIRVFSFNDGWARDVPLTATVTSGIDRVVFDCYVDTWTYYFLNVADNSSPVHVIVKATSGDDTMEFPFDLPVEFSVSENDAIDEMVEVTDDQYGALGTPWAQVDPNTTFYFTTYDYSQYVGPYASCGKYEVRNTASFVTLDTRVTGSESWNILVDVPCVPGCTLASGYWKTHSRFGPAPYDNAWTLLGEDTPFFLSGQSYYQVLWTPPAGGNAYYILAHAYIATKLNILNGADPAAAQAAMASATALFNSYKPSANLGRSVRSQFISLAAALDGYNNGVTGPGHCSK